MRISEWSSDVCSSDLVETFVRPFVSKLSLARQEVGSLLRSIRSALHDMRKSAEPKDARRHHRHLKALMAEIRLVVSKHEIAFANISGWVMSRLKRLSRVAMSSMKGELPEGMRSEEHTSELQSLMRISYAVLCLKKKK